MRTVFAMGAFERSPFWLGQGAISKADRDALLKQLADAQAAAEYVQPWTKALKPEDDKKFDDLRKKAYDLSLTVFQVGNKLKAEEPAKWIVSDQEIALIGAYGDMMDRLYEMATGKPFVPPAAGAAAPKPPESKKSTEIGPTLPAAPSEGVSTTTILVAAGGVVVLGIGAAILLS